MLRHIRTRAGLPQVRGLVLRAGVIVANFSVLPPEVNSARMYAGPGPGSLLAAAAAWDVTAAGLAATGASFASMPASVGESWRAAATLTAGMAVPCAQWLSGVGAQAAEQARAVVGVYEAALAAMVHPAAVTANRVQFVALVTSNLFGQNAPAIAAAESEYEQMWAQDVAAMAGYHSAASAATSQLWRGRKAGAVGGRGSMLFGQAAATGTG
jgi:PPE-repeat protein